WEDRSGHDRDVTQATAAARPTLRLGVAGGEPAVRFDGVDDELRGSDSITPRTVLAVVRINSNLAVVLGSEAADDFGYFRLDGNDVLYASAGTGPSSGAAHAACTRGSLDVLAATMAGTGSDSERRVNGATVGTGATSDAPGDTLIVGARKNPANQWF